MKKLAFMLCIILLPFVLLASASSYLDYLRGFQLPTETSRGFRINHSIGYTNDMGDWLQETKNVYHYNSAQGWVESLNTYQYNTETSAWEEFMTGTFEHDSYGRVTSSLISVSMIGLTFPVMSTSALYDSQHRLIHYYVNSYDFATGSLFPAIRMHIEYSATNISAMYNWEYDSELEVPTYEKTTFGFDAQGRVIETINQTSPDSLAWVNDSRGEITYHAHDTGNAASMIEYISAALPAAFFFDNIFNTPGMPTTEINSEWNGTGWELSSKQIYSYNPNDKIANTQEDYWNGAWEPDNKKMWTYDSNGNYTEILEQYYNMDSWYDSNKTVFAWEQTSDNEDQNAPPIGSLILNAYPIPFSGTLTLMPISTKAGKVEIQIYNMKGQLLNSLATLPGKSTQWNGLDNKGNKTGSGIYFIKASQQGATTINRVIKLK
ncbi:MAG: T9SS type A sorting domain-containing protein [Candidatus Cloacimonetes bacterium]|nr:T9SS type A sorting domain-containing protein [Candidatus Cloacimonadota bacterium]